MKVLQSYVLYPFAFILVMLLPSIAVPKIYSLLFINGLHSSFADEFFKKVTWLGEGFLIGCCIFSLVFLRVKWLFVFIIGLIIHILCIQLNKQLFFNDVLRPFGYLELLCREQVLHYASGITIRHEVSFPSGHTTGAAFAASFLSLIFNRRKVSIVLATVALTIGFSRIYLGQHFLIDVYFGFFFGTVSSVIGFVVVGNLETKYQWMNNYLIHIKSKCIKTGIEMLKDSVTKGLHSSPKY